MKSCPKMREYDLQKQLSSDDETHLLTCEVCRAHAKSWVRVKEAVDDWDPSAGRSVTSDVRTAALVREARARMEGGVRGSGKLFLAGAALAACVAIAIITTISFQGLKEREGDTPPAKLMTFKLETIVSMNAKVSNETSSPARTVSSAANGRLLVDAQGDLLGLGSDSRAVISKTTAREIRVALNRGVVAVSAKKRTPGESLIVDAGGVTISVVGTDFSVEIAGDDYVHVAVTRGKVKIANAQANEVFLREGEHYRYRDGQGAIEKISSSESMRIESLLEPNNKSPDRHEPSTATGETPPVDQAETLVDRTANTRGRKPRQVQIESGMTLQEAKALILTGRNDEAEAGLLKFLARSPRDADAWMLLATSRRKLGKWSKAVEAFSEAAKHGTPRQAGRARFMAAVVLQDDMGNPKRAGMLLELYLGGASGTKPLESKALLRLTRIKLSLGNHDEAREIAKRLKSRYPGTDDAISASKLVEKK